MITQFTGVYAFLSNFHMSPQEAAWFPTPEASTRIWPTNEHYFQAAKTLDPVEMEMVRAAANPGGAKRLGRKVALRPDWNEVRLDAMLTGLRAKFSMPPLALQLLATQDEELSEGNHWGDKYWGVNRYGVGENHLGRLLMQVRGELQ